MTDIAHAPASPKNLLDEVPTELFVGGQWRAAENAARFDVESPATGEVLAAVADASPADGRAALDAAVEAQHHWADTAPRERAEILRSAWELTMERREQLASLMTAEMGKPLAEARGEVDYGGEFLRWFGEEAVRIAGRTQISPEGRLRIEVMKRPVGPSLFITPWNFPLAMATRKTAPALAAGCTVVLKPAAATPLTALAFGKILQDAGLPAGVVNVVPTSSSSELTAPLIQDHRLRKLSFTGSTQVGMKLLEEAAGNVLRTSMELGGSAPFIVFEDADLGLAVEAALQAKLRNMGEACTAANRFFVHESVLASFVEALTERFERLRVGPGDGPGVDLGPLISARQRDEVHRLVSRAVAEGGKVLTGGEIRPGAGYFYPPTVIAGVDPCGAIMREEIFGPVAAVASFSGEDEVVAMANSTEVGLAGYVFTGDSARIQRMSRRLEVGMLGVNTGLISNAAAPFGGVKHSGLGREGGAEGIEEFLETVYIATPAA
jgi:succinate-semialdehyde dehydrogenase / glutarate-semialdehyde dehydrogenase